jgi:hypothetical protein
MKGKPPTLIILILGFLIFPFTGHADQQGFSVGYGFGLLNKSMEFGRLRGTNGYYDFAQFTYAYEKNLAGTVNLLLEPFLAVINRPDNGLDTGLGVSGKYYFGKKNHEGLFLTLGTGASYTTVAFQEQGTHLLFILQGGIGYQWQHFYIENRFRHYSNGGLSSPNRSVNANIVNVGWFF